MRTTNSVGQGLPTEEKLAARSAAAESGVVAGVCARVEAFIGKYGAEGHAVGNKLSIADIAVFTTFSFVSFASSCFQWFPPYVSCPFTRSFAGSTMGSLGRH